MNLFYETEINTHALFPFSVITSLPPVFSVSHPQSWSERGGWSREEGGIPLWGNIQVGAAPHNMMPSVTHMHTHSRSHKHTPTHAAVGKFTTIFHCWNTVLILCACKEIPLLFFIPNHTRMNVEIKITVVAWFERSSVNLKCLNKSSFTLLPALFSFFRQHWSHLTPMALKTYEICRARKSLLSWLFECYEYKPDVCHQQACVYSHHEPWWSRTRCMQSNNNHIMFILGGLVGLVCQSQGTTCLNVLLQVRMTSR